MFVQEEGESVVGKGYFQSTSTGAAIRGPVTLLAELANSDTHTSGNGGCREPLSFFDAL